MLSMTTVTPSAPVDTRPRNLDRMMLAAVAALTLTVAASCVSIVFDIGRLTVLNHLVSDTSSGDVIRFPSDLAAAHTSDDQTSVISAIELGTFVIAGLCFIARFHRAYTDLMGLGAATVRHALGWAIGGWFVPILNLWRPK